MIGVYTYSFHAVCECIGYGYLIITYRYTGFKMAITEAVDNVIKWEQQGSLSPCILVGEAMVSRALACRKLESAEGGIKP